jgi:uncharacterized protein YdeI (BOF family)
VALRGEEVLKTISFLQPEIEKDPLIVTPVGICLNYYDQKNSFIMVRFNGERIKLYDNNRLTIVDAALQAGFPNEYLFPRRGQAINFTVDGKQRMIRGEVGESSTVRLNGKEVNINTPLEPNCEIEIVPSTVGGDAAYTIENLEEYTSSTIAFEVNHHTVTCPRFVLVNGRLEPPTYQIQDGDQITVCNYYTVAQLAEFMDVVPDQNQDIMVNNRPENMDAQIYENFSVDWTVMDAPEPTEDVSEPEEAGPDMAETPVSEPAAAEKPKEAAESGEEVAESEEEAAEIKEAAPEEVKEEATEEASEETVEEAAPEPTELSVFVNGELITMKGKPEYVFIDVFDYIDFDLSDSRGRAIITQVNEKNAFYTQTLNEGDEVVIRWEESQGDRA